MKMINGNEKDAIDIARLISNEIQERQSQNRHIVLAEFSVVLA